MKTVYSIGYRVCGMKRSRDRPKYCIPHTAYHIPGTGFTLIELLVVVAVMAIMGVVTANLFFQTLKGATKAQLLTEIKQNGDYTLSLMGKMIRNAKNIEETFPENPSWKCDSSNRPDIKITNQDGGTTYFNCTGSGDNTHIASNAARLTSSRVRVSSDCNLIKCTRTGSAPPIVEISFSLSQLGSPTRPEEAAAVNFRTSVSLRTY